MQKRTYSPHRHIFTACYICYAQNPTWSDVFGDYFSTTPQCNPNLANWPADLSSFPFDTCEAVLLYIHTLYLLVNSASEGSFTILLFCYLNWWYSSMFKIDISLKIEIFITWVVVVKVLCILFLWYGCNFFITVMLSVKKVVLFCRLYFKSFLKTSLQMMEYLLEKYK